MRDMMEAWKEAEQDLGITVDRKFKVALQKETKTFVLVQDFGGPNGTIVTSNLDTKDFKELQELGFYCSALADTYFVYERKLFIETLNDWGFFGEENQKPSWYTGKGWTD